jgi:hypothetical protein
MPKHGAMAQISRPFQIALLAVLALAVVGVLALRLHPTSSSSGSSSAVATAVPAPTDAAPVKSKTSTVAASKTKAVTPHRVHHSAHAVNAHAVKAAAGAAASSKHVAGKSSASKAVTKTASPTKTAVAPTIHKVKPVKGSASTLASPSGQRRVEAQLAHGDIALVLFWNPKGTEDVSVHQALRTVAERSGVGVNQAPAGAVASFGTITRGIQIYETPTLLVINKKGQTTVLTGVQDAYSIEQAISEARHS